MSYLDIYFPHTCRSDFDLFNYMHKNYHHIYNKATNPNTIISIICKDTLTSKSIFPSRLYFSAACSKDEIFLAHIDMITILCIQLREQCTRFMYIISVVAVREKSAQTSRQNSHSTQNCILLRSITSSWTSNV